MTFSIIDVSDRENPDLSNIEDKRTIDISVSQFDIDAGLSEGDIPPEQIRLNYTGQGIVLLDDKQNETSGDIYYTSVYAEKLDYAVWKQRVNKQFFELENQ